MPRSARALAAGLLAVLLAVADSGCAEHACTAMAGSDGFAVHLDDALATRLAEGRVQLCFDSACSEQQIPAASTAMVQTCNEGQCADSTVPQVDINDVFFALDDADGTEVTIAPRPPRRTVSVAVRSFDRTGLPVVAGTVQVTLQDAYLNGPDCGVTNVLGKISLTSAGVSVGA